MSSNPLASPQAELQWWADAVSEFGGRISATGKEELVRALSESNLGTASIVVPVGDLTKTQFEELENPNRTLCEVKLPFPMLMDLTIDVDGILETAAGEPGSFGNGLIRVTWGTPGGRQKTVDVSIMRGWRYPFTASYLRAEYIVFDPASGGNNDIAAPQPRNLEISGTITPASGAPVVPLRKDVYYAQVNAFALGEVRSIPRYAASAKFTVARLFVGGVTDLYWQIKDAGGSNIHNVDLLIFEPGQDAWEIGLPQKAALIRLVSNGEVGLSPIVSYALAL